MRRPSSALDRRDFLRVVVAAAGPVVACGTSDRSEELEPSSSFFPQSIASGDPRPTSVVLWTRVEDPGGGEELELELEVALDESFAERLELAPGTASLSLVAEAANDHCAKVRVENLEPGTTYYYRFTYRAGDEAHVSRVGRTRTAPDPEADVAVTFAVLSCQDYGGKYFHALRHAAERDLDFVVHLGDYVYETVDDPGFQDPTRSRATRFRNPDEARPRGTSRLAARSFGNYCDLYRIVRTDPDLQRLHERFPIVAVWDDHEFSNDCHGTTATYADGRENEDDPERRRNADRAWYSYMPVDYEEPPAAALDTSREFPDDFRIHRGFVFGRHLELVMTDLRRFKPDHIVPEDAFPGSVFLDEAESAALLGDEPEGALPYVDIETFADGTYADALRAAAPALGIETERIRGLLSVPWVNQTLARAGIDDPAPIDESDPELARGYAYVQLLKTEPYGSFGARNLIAEIPFRALALKRWNETGGNDETSGASELLMGTEQRAWFTSTLLASTRTWKVWGNEYTLMPRVLDLRGFAFAPEEFRTRILLSADDWDGAPNERALLLRELAGVENVVVVTGDLHAFFAGTPHPPGDSSARVVEFVGGSVSSTPWLTTIRRVVESDPSVPDDAASVALAVGSLLLDTESRPNPHIGWLDLENNGYLLLRAGAEFLEATAFAIGDSLVARAPRDLPGTIESRFRATEFRVPSGSRDLEQNIGGTWRRWDLELMRWV